MQEAQYVCLVRATDGNKKITTTVRAVTVSASTSMVLSMWMAFMIGTARAVYYVQDMQLQTSYSSQGCCAGQRKGLQQVSGVLRYHSEGVA